MSPTALLLGFFLALLVSLGSAQCYKRKEYRDTTDEEWRLFKEALLSLQHKPSPKRQGWSEWDDFAYFHNYHARQTHNTPMFFPWHRAFLQKLENRLRSLDPKYANVFIPYWSWSYDWRHAPATPLLKQGSSRNLYVPNDGVLRTERSSSCLVYAQVPNGHCIRRSYRTSTFDTYLSSEAIASIIVQYSRYDDFRKKIEVGAHGEIHVSLGGSVGDLSTMISPNDPVFFLLHASIDRMWYLWQSLDTRRKTSYYGSLDQTIPGFSFTVRQMVNANSCWSYVDYAPDTDLTLASVKARKASSAEDPVINSLANVVNCLPPPLPDKWLEMNGFDPLEVRQIESEFHQIVARTKTSMQCASATASNAASRDEDFDNNSSTTAPTSSQRVAITSTHNTIPAWGAGLLVMGACIIVLMVVFLFLVLRPHLG